MIDHAPHGWFLLEEDGALFLDVNCSHSFVSYNFMLRLDAQERSAYESEGRAFINRLATAVQDSGPNSRSSRFYERNLSGTYSDEVTKTIEDWRASS
ncbi:hypothetical protein G4G28_18400 [Massilia sp. Dwa41.01b]|uniref:hypothetical protein n=1 Tax=Massilia sp. Dwa41.01b TaxID=2709302 RepID=UPI001603F2DF|nr:hypothetical protein [Massilia sp. Dwa41.01b]QNA89978.1 hypothetical protein G4G28_18400 [Massilia sp. Dwa41.01b]